MTFVLLPRFYQTGWFRGLCVLAALLAAGWGYSHRTRQLRRQNHDLEVKVAGRTRELAAANGDLQAAHDELAAQNDELQSIQAELEAQNDELHAVQAELETQNRRLEIANARLESLATTDGLTGLNNHRAFQERLEHEWERAARYHVPLSLLLLDVDRFKSYNDTFGHPAGDAVLRGVGEILKGHARDSDFVARYGGEEFVILLPHTDAAGGAAFAERLRAAVEAAPWDRQPVTASFGVATVTPAMGGGAALIAAADAALYRSKRCGRNRVTHAGDGPVLRLVGPST